MDDYIIETKKGQGTYSEVFTAFSKKYNKYVAIKCLKAPYQTIQNVKKQKQIQALKQLSHPNIIKLLDVLFDQPSGRLALVFQLMDYNLYQYLKQKKKQIDQQKVKEISYQILKAVKYMHNKKIFHRDIKPENILISSNKIKLADFGSCKNFKSDHPFTQYISTRWYRAPQCLMTDGYYDQKMDIWGIGCVIFQLFSKFPIFPGKDQLDQINKIHNILGTPPVQILQRFQKNASHMQFNFFAKKGIGVQKLIPQASPKFIDLIEKLLIYDPVKRLTAEEALKHNFYFQLMRQQENKSLKKKRNDQSLQFLPPIYGIPSVDKYDKYNKIQKKKKDIQTHRLHVSDIYEKKFSNL